MFKRIIIALLLAAAPSLLLAASENSPQQQERTLSIIKPDAVRGQHIGEIISQFEKGGLRVAAIKMVHLTKKDAMQFYDVHRDRDFYRELTAFMSSGPVVVMVLEGDNAVAKNRTLMGSTDPAKAAPETIRSRFGSSIQNNAVHGSDSPENGEKEIAFFFGPKEIFGKY